MIPYQFLNGLIVATSGAVEKTAEAAHGEGELQTHVPNLLTFVFGPEIAEHYAVTFFAFLIATVMIACSFVVYRRRDMIPGPFQNVVEMLFEALYDLVYSMLGKQADRYIPFLGTLFIYIWFMNLSGLVPFVHAPTSAINMTAALAITVFFYVQYIAWTRLGFLKYMHHLAGEPNSAVTWALVIINFPLHVVGEFIKPASLAMRLFGNIMGEDTLIAVMISLGVVSLSFMHSPVGLPFQLPFIFLSLLLGTIQALVFTLLSTGYIMMVLPHEEH